jgi:hypothetical protein
VEDNISTALRLAAMHDPNHQNILYIPVYVPDKLHLEMQPIFWAHLARYGVRLVDEVASLLQRPEEGMTPIGIELVVQVLHVQLELAKGLRVLHVKLEITERLRAIWQYWQTFSRVATQHQLMIRRRW